MAKRKWIYRGFGHYDHDYNERFSYYASVDIKKAEKFGVTEQDFKRAVNSWTDEVELNSEESDKYRWIIVDRMIISEVKQDFEDWLKNNNIN